MAVSYTHLVFWGLAAAALGYAVALGIQTAATWIANGAAQAFFTTLLTNPLFWIAPVSYTHLNHRNPRPVHG